VAIYEHRRCEQTVSRQARVRRQRTQVSVVVGQGFSTASPHLVRGVRLAVEG
jgi:hypothetical protein